MNITDLLDVIKISHISGVPLYIHGLQGIGKSSIVKQYIKNSYHFYKTPDGIITDNQWLKLSDTSHCIGMINYGYVDYRVAQMEVSDLSGLPDRDLESKRTIYYSPEKLPHGKWINQNGDISNDIVSPEDGNIWTSYKGILFIDEINRGQDDVLNSLFELIYDRKLHSYSLPDGWGIIAAGNPANSSFSVNSFIDDDAFKDRFCHIFLQFNNEYRKSWVNYMYEMEIEENLIHKITNFCMLDDTHLHNDDDDSDFVIKVSPRSWEFVAKIEHTILRYPINEQARFFILKGLIGDVASYYVEHNIDVYPHDLIKNGISKYIKSLKKYNRNQIQSLSWGVARQAKRLHKIQDERLKELPDKIMQNVIEFGKWVMTFGEDYRDLAVAFFDILLQVEQKSDLRKLSFSNNSIKKLLSNHGKSRWYNMIIKDAELEKLIRLSHGGEL